MPLERCQRPHCGGWMKEIINPDNKIEKICSKCAWPPDLEIERDTNKGKRKFTELDQIFKAMNRQKERNRRNLIKLQKEDRA